MSVTIFAQINKNHAVTRTKHIGWQFRQNKEIHSLEKFSCVSTKSFKSSKWKSECNQCKHVYIWMIIACDASPLPSFEILKFDHAFFVLFWFLNSTDSLYRLFQMDWITNLFLRFYNSVFCSISVAFVYGWIVCGKAEHPDAFGSSHMLACYWMYCILYLWCVTILKYAP